MRARFAVLLTATVLTGAGCNSILGINDHELAGAAAGAGGATAGENGLGGTGVGGTAAGGNSGLAGAAAGGSKGLGGAAVGGNNGLAGASRGDSAGAAGEAGGGQPCVEGDVECSSVNPTVPQSCDSSGHWVDGHACKYVCASGMCIGVCTPGMTQCSDVTPQTCDDTGEWVDGSVMADTCKAVCTPGDHQCQVNDLMTCQGNGTWQVTSSCPYGCLNSLCRDKTYGTIGLAGSVTCETSPGLLTCATTGTTTTPCCWNYTATTGTCYAATCPSGYNPATNTNDNFSVACDGPNDCAAGQVCCFFYVSQEATTRCATECSQPAPPAPVTEQTVCDPGAPTCATGSCKPMTVYGAPKGTPLYTCH